MTDHIGVIFFSHPNPSFQPGYHPTVGGLVVPFIGSSPPDCCFQLPILESTSLIERQTPISVTCERHPNTFVNCSLLGLEYPLLAAPVPQPSIDRHPCLESQSLAAPNPHDTRLHASP
ncbi:hypothetical protein TIFTF001_000172 [Ficus carica]|uniref:Uncharacterized protein n=1 Tax=Ficus carica TaxID=3494 RepID=A0AA87ZC40_FICCA|nr:hypothetical protein TIFTF001_000172 [Ficus carica]